MNVQRIKNKAVHWSNTEKSFYLLNRKRFTNENFNPLKTFRHRLFVLQIFVVLFVLFLFDNQIFIFVYLRSARVCESTVWNNHVVEIYSFIKRNKMIKTYLFYRKTPESGKASGHNVWFLIVSLNWIFKFYSINHFSQTL